MHHRSRNSVSRKRPASPATRGKWLILSLVLTLVLLAFGATAALGANPPPQQTYYVSLPEDDLLQLFDDDDVAGGAFPDPTSPIRSITSISIGSTGTLVYYDQWEDGGYDADIANPGGNVYANPGNLDGTQIWGDGVLANGCPPNIKNVPNPCTVAANDLLKAGDVIILDEDVIVGGTTPGPYNRSASLIFFDGRDKFGTTFPVAVTRGAFPISPGSVMAGANEVLDTERWGTSYEAPLGEDTLDTNTNAFEDVRWFIMAGAGGATIDVDANGDGDLLDANDLNDFVMTEGAKRQVNGILMGATLTVVSGNPVQVNSMTADVDDTFEFRWDALLDRDAWTNNYYTPVGTAPKASDSGCTEVEVYNPNGSTITINYDFPGGASPNGSFTVAPGNTATGLTTPATPLVPYNNGARYWSEGGQNFLPISVTDCTRDLSGTDGRLYDWGNPLFPSNQLTAQVLVPFAKGCSGESFLGVCRDSDSQSPYETRDVTTDGSRSVVWVTPLANTTIYVDYDGSGFSCPGGTGSDTSIPASALVSYRITNDPTARAYVRHGFGSGNYTGTDNIGQGWTQTSSAWAANWAETGDEGTFNAGAIQVVTNELRLGNTGTSNETGWTVRRGVSLTGQNYANLRFHLRDNGLAATDKLAVEVTNDGTNWTRLATFQGDQVAAAYDPIATTYATNISPWISANTAVRFVILNNITSANFWFVDDVHIDYAVGGDWDMTGARIGTCDGVKIAAAWGQDPALSGSNDEEALDMGTGIAPFGSDIAIDKSADKTQVAQGGLVNYTFKVTNLGAINLVAPITVTDNKCSPVVPVNSGGFNIGDINPPDGKLNPFPAETWTFTCSSNIYFDTDNVAFATGTPEGETTPINSAPDEWLVTVIPPAVVGNYVWLDEDGDGDQDAGEAGIPNVKVTLTGTDTFGNAVNLTTYTDANGGYLFDGLAPSNASGYTVTVTPPVGLNQTYDENGLGTPNATTVVLAAGDEHLTADFGYNWAPSGDTNTPPTNALGAIGDRVWIDADGDGAQDPGEAGIPGVTVTLYTDPDGNGIYDTVAGTATTDAAGNYIFDGLPAGAYVVQVTPPAGYAQTGDPDGLLDHKTSSPVVLGPGDVYVNADFGYQPTGNSSDIGDRVWLDADADGVQDASEKGIPGVTVALLRDDGDGVYEPGIDLIIATDITDENGLYLFPGLPAGTYFVLVTDTENVLGELAPTYDADGSKDQRSKVTINGIADNLLQDFGYAPPGHQAGQGLIGDTIWLDRDADSTPDPGEGLEGVRVTLTEPGADGVLGTADDTTRDTFTDENGNYSFGSLQPTYSYRVTVDTTTTPAGTTNTVDPDGGNNSTSVVDLSLSPNGINLNQDFAYRDTTSPNTIGGTLWEDRNADGVLTGGEAARFAGVTVILKDVNGDIVATTTTDSNGNYLFTGLPDGTYTVDVTDDANTLNGYWKSDSPNPTLDNNSHVDPFTLSVSGGAVNTTVDFGYYIDPAALGNFVWHDLDNDGIQDAGEPGIAGVRVALTITYPNGDVTTLYTVTDASGYYEFGNLLLDEDYNGIGAGEPTFSIAVASVPAGYAPTLINQGGNDAVDADNPAGVAATTTQGSTNDIYDFGYVRTASIGNAVWLDENGDGIQDAGESGIPNITVQLWDATHTNVVATTVTDANGGYLFTNVPPGTYQVDVLNSSLPAGMVQSTPTFEGGDFTNKVDPYTVTVAPGGENLTADFGYNWAPTSDVQNNTGAGAIGDRVWVDVDGDGFQDPEEVGLDGVTVELWYDSNNDGVIDALYPTGGTTSTNATGNYIFDNLPAGIYEVRVTAGTGSFTQTGDPDHFGTTGAVNDAKTTTPIVLAPGDVFVNADFGYQPNAGLYAPIGDTVWFDANANGIQEAGEYGIPGVTVSLILDANNNNNWDPGEKIIATDTTAADGTYLFPGAKVGGNYLVWVNDTDNVLAGMTPTYDSDGIASPNLSAVSSLPASGNLLQDFGYTAFGATPGRGLIGDTIFLDRNGSNTFNPGEGVEGVVVELRDASNNLIATTVTDENGLYYFVNLPVTGPGVTYNVVVAASNFAAGGPLQGTNNTVDPDGGNNSTSQLTLTTGSPTNLAQDFGYAAAAPGSIGNLVWNDLNADGVVNAGENGIQGVTVDLYRDLNGNGRIDPGEPKIGATTTDANGAYLFSGLPTTGGNYVVDVSDTAGVLTGWWHSLGTAGVNDNSQADPYAVTLTAGAPNNLTADFGYYVKPAAIGNWVWQETVGSVYGRQDAGEVGIPNVEVKLTITWPGGGTTILKTLTDATGYYSFGNLLLDENMNGVGSGEPTFTITVDTSQPALAGLTASPITIPEATTATDSNDPAGTVATAIQGQTNTSAANDAALINWTDFGFYPEGTTPVSLAFFSATRNGDRVNFEWTTATEAGNAGFNLYVQTKSGSVKINDKLIRSRVVSSLQPQDYVYQANVSGGDAFFIEEVSILQAKQAYGPYQTGQPAGARLSVEPIDWAAVNAEHDMKQAEREAQDAAKINEALQADGSQSRLESPLTSFVKRITERTIGRASINMAKKPTPIALPTTLSIKTPTPRPTATPQPPPTGAPTPTAQPPATPLRVAELKVNRTGLYRVTYEALLASGLNLAGKPASDLALTLRNSPVPIRVSSPATFGPGAFIEFYGEALDTLYTDTNIYTLWVDRALAQRISVDATAPAAGAPLPTYYMETTETNQQRKYDFSARSSDPWYDLAMWVDRGQSATWDRSITLENYVAGGAPSTLRVGFWGALDYPPSPDHHVVVKLNGQNIADHWFNGLDASQVISQLPVDLARNGANTLTLVMPGDLPAGADLDGMRLDRYSITYPRSFTARSGRLTFKASGPVFQVSGLPNDNVVVYRLDGNTPVFLSGSQAAGGNVTFAGINGGATYVVSAVESALRPTIVPAATPADIRTGAARYLVIAHPDFMSGLAPLVQARQAQGFTVKVVNVEEVYRQFSGGVFDPTAIREYIKHAATNMGTEYVLLVGADTYDYRNYLGLNGISFIPSLYVATDDIVRYAPVDPLYADTDGNGAPNLAIGRFPVRTSAELTALVNKTLAYANKTYGRTAIFAADRYFGADSNNFIGQMPANWSVRKAHLDEIGVAASRTLLLKAMNEGVALTSFVGHSGLTVWTQEGLFSATDAAALTNVGKPTVVTQWGCWNTYYVDPAYKTLGQKLMGSGENGSLAVLGPTTLTLASSERRLGQLLTPRMTQPGLTIGAAIQAAKAEMALTQPNAIDVLLGWSLLGDPAVIVQP